MAVTSPPAITALPAAPDPNNRATYNALAYPWSVAQAVLATQVGAVAANVFANATDAAASAGTATTQAGLATSNGAAQVALAVAQVGAATAKATLTAADALATAADRVQTGLDRTAAAASAAAAAALAGAFVGTSASSMAIAAGSKTFTTQAGEQYSAGIWMTAVSQADPANWMFGEVTSYSGTTLVIDVQTVGGSGTFADWNLSLAGPRGAQGIQGIPGALAGPATGVIDLLTGANIAGAATINLNTATGNRVHITGSGWNCTAVTLTRGPRTVIFDGIGTLTHHATNNNLPGAATITTAAGDRAIYESDGTTVYCIDYIKASGTAVVGGVSMVRSARTSNTALGVADNGKLIDITSGTFTQTLDAAATLGAGWWCYLRNSGSGTVTVDPNASETIDGVTTGALTPGLCVLLACDATGFSAQRIGTSPVVEVKESGTSWVAPMGVRSAKIRLVGGGSSGIFTGNTTRASGVGGGYLEKTLSVIPGAAYPYAVGAGGLSATSSVPFVNAGGATTFTAGGITYTANGGSPAARYSQCSGGTAVNGDINITGGCNSMLSSDLNGSVGGSTPLGSGGGQSCPATGYGAGGSPSGAATGSGTPGVLILEY